MLAYFRRQNGRAFFPPPPIAARLPRRCAGQTQMAALGMFRVAGVVSQREETGLFFFCVCRYPCINNTAWDASMRLGYFCNAKGQRDFISTLAFSASHEACRRMAVFSTQLTRKLHQTREPWHLSCHGGKIPANPHVLLHPCAAPPRSSGSRGTAPCASRGTCRATAVKPQPTRMSPYAPARLRRAVRKGAQPLRGTAPA